VLTSQSPLPTLDDVPVTLVARVRGKTNGDIRLTLYDVVGDDGRAESRYVSTGASDAWSELVLRVERVRRPSESDNFSVGVFGAAPGDWFEVADLRLRRPAAIDG